MTFGYIDHLENVGGNTYFETNKYTDNVVHIFIHRPFISSFNI